MPNIKNASIRNATEKNGNHKDDDIQCDIWQAWIHLKCNRLNHIDYKYLQRSSDPWFCLCCCSLIYQFGFLTNKDFSSYLYTSSTSFNF